MCDAVPPFFLLFAGLLLANRKDNQTGSSGHQQNAEDAILPHTVIASDRQVGALGVDHGERHTGTINSHDCQEK